MTTHEPLLEGVLRREATLRVREIAERLAVPHEEWTLSGRPDDTGLRTISLGLGRCGHAVFFAHLASSQGGVDPETAGETALGLLEESIEQLPSADMDASLLCGFPGVAWAVEHVLSVLGQPQDGEDDLNADIDESLLEGLSDPSFVPAYDLIDGLAGHGIYALERRGRPLAERMIDAILKRLERTACVQSVGVSWPSGMLTRTAQGQDVEVDERYFNLGLSHGVPGVVGILSRFASVPSVRSRAMSLLASAVDWLLAQRLPAGGVSAYPDFVADGVTPDPARLAWCYGDPGVAVTLCGAGMVLGRPDVVAHALEVAHVASCRELDGSGVVDAGLCHGSAGVAHLFHRIYRATGDETCREAALSWLARLLERREDVPNVAGLATYCFERKMDGEYIEDPAWLTGAAGAGLVLLSALSDLPLPTWDRALLVDIPF
ncbi:MAG: lanthionine synthetase C family protein [Candidatus Eisenbacteria bacterium]|uniref:Lanthionine synthetase C family protein n=1 Tax=Eiseniibacteriota bacterium TaxID=2212470 RepID=A0A956SDQ1_UNCEI|nr:lanthionine synthetase C family protein [Candidatus Eisenbacteria bacterium]